MVVLACLARDRLTVRDETEESEDTIAPLFLLARPPVDRYNRRYAKHFRTPPDESEHLSLERENLRTLSKVI